MGERKEKKGIFAFGTVGVQEVFLPLQLDTISGIHTPVLAMSKQSLRQKKIEFLCVDSEPTSAYTVDDTFQYFREADIPAFDGIQFDRDTIRRPILYGAFRQLNQHILSEDVIEINPAMRKKGIATAFHKQIEDLARSRGYSFLVAFHNSAETASHFIREGRYFVEEIRPEHLNSLKPFLSELDPEVFGTVSFLSQELVDQYIEPEWRTSNVETRLQHAETFLSYQKSISVAIGLLNRSKNPHELVHAASLFYDLGMTVGLAPDRIDAIGNMSNTTIEENRAILKEIADDFYQNRFLTITMLDAYCLEQCSTFYETYNHAYSGLLDQKHISLTV